MHFFREGANLKNILIKEIGTEPFNHVIWDEFGESKPKHHFNAQFALFWCK